jgi:hypothetical protein
MKLLNVFNTICIFIFLVYVCAVIGALNPGCETAAVEKIDSIYWGFLGSFGVIGSMIVLLALLGGAYYVLLQFLRQNGGRDWMVVHWKLLGGSTLVLVILVPIIIYVGFHWGFAPIR